MPPATRFQATITCPRCGHNSVETMPVDACLFIYDCKACGMPSRPRAGDCCVFCSFADRPCPPRQADDDGEPAT